MNPSDHPLVIALRHVLAEEAERLGVPVDDVGVEAVEATDWPDACLGLAGPGEACAEVITPGHLVRLAGGARYRTDLRGAVRREPEEAPEPSGPATVDTEIRLTLSVSGGITGRPREFATESGRLRPAEEQELRRLLTEADFFQVPNALPSPVADGVTRRLWIAVGRRNHEVVRGDGIEIEDPPAVTALFAWAEERLPPLVGAGDAGTA